MALTAAPVAQRGYVLVRPASAPSAIVSRVEAERMQRRFGGVIVSARGLRYRTVRRGVAMRVLLEAEYPALAERVAQRTAEVAA